MRARDGPDSFVPIGTGHAGAMFRTGLAELRNAVVDPGSNVAVGHTEAGIYGTATQFEVNQERHGEALSKTNEGSSIIDERVRQAEMSRDGRGRESPELDKE